MIRYFVEVTSGGRAGLKMELTDLLVLGRAPDNHISFPVPGDQGVSGHHAQLELRDGEVTVRDRNSTNGTFVNGERCQQQLLQPGDVVSLGFHGPKIRFVTLRLNDPMPQVPPGGAAPAPRGQSVGASRGPSASDSGHVGGRRDPASTRPETPVPGARGSRGRPIQPRSDVPIQPETEQESSSQPFVFDSSPQQSTVDDSRASESSSPLEGEDEPSEYTTHDLPASDDGLRSRHGEAGEYTIAFARRLSIDETDAEELEAVFQDHGRVERLIATGALNARDALFFRSAAAAYRKGKKKSVIIIATLGGIALIALALLAYQNFAYSHKVDKKESLLSDIRELEKQIEQGGENAEEQQALMAKLRASKLELLNLRPQLNEKDRQIKYYHPLGNEIQWVLEDFGKMNYVVPDDFIAQVATHVDAFNSTSMRKVLEISFANKPKYHDMIEEELEKHGMPSAFFYLAMHESRLDPTIVSHMGARGIWQLMPDTARKYGLEVPEDWESRPAKDDQRTDPKLSTRAAVLYLRGLLAEFGDVALAMSAYNAGSWRVRESLHQLENPLRNRDFWLLYRMGTLPDETNEYVPKIIATMIIDQHRERYGFEPE